MSDGQCDFTCEAKPTGHDFYIAQLFLLVLFSYDHYYYYL